MEEKNQSEKNDKQNDASPDRFGGPFSKNSSLDERPPESLQTDEPPSIGDSFAEMGQVQEATRFQLFMRKALTWLAVVLVAYLGGMITFFFAFYQPKVDKLNQTDSSLNEAKQEISDLQEQLDAVTAQRDTLKNADDYRALLSIMVDTYEARLALAEENSAAAKSALSDTNQSLNEIMDVIRDFDAKLSETIPQRLKLIQANLDGNIQNAIADCDLLIKDLQSIEKALYQ